jgi:hypothetical protein
MRSYPAVLHSRMVTNTRQSTGLVGSQS